MRAVRACSPSIPIACTLRAYALKKWASIAFCFQNSVPIKLVAFNTLRFQILHYDGRQAHRFGSPFWVIKPSVPINTNARE